MSHWLFPQFLMPNICPWISHPQHVCSTHPLLHSGAAFKSTIFYPVTWVLFSDWLICSHMSFFDWLMGSDVITWGRSSSHCCSSCFTFHCIYSGVAWWALHIRFSWLRNMRCGSREWENVKMCASHPQCVRLESFSFSDPTETSFILMFLEMT